MRKSRLPKLNTVAVYIIILFNLSSTFSDLAFSDTCEWIASVGAWSEPNNWSCFKVPDENDDAHISNGGTSVITRTSSVGGLNVFTHSGLKIVDGHLTCSGSVLFDYNSIGEQSDGILTADYVMLGVSRDGHFIHTGGTMNCLSRLSIGGMYMLPTGLANGSYLLEGAAKVTAGNIIIADSYESNGIFVQNGGEVAAADYMSVGPGSDSIGTYRLTAGELTVPHEFFGTGSSGTGIFEQSGGTNTASNMIALRNGNYYIDDGTLNAYDLVVGMEGMGNFIQTGGIVNINDDIIIAQELGSSGTYDCNNGVLCSSNLFVGLAGTGNFVQRGGTVNIFNDVLIGFPNTDGAYELSGGGLNIVGNLNVAQSGTGNFTQTGGIVNIEDNVGIGLEPNSIGTYMLSEGELSIGGRLDLSRLGTGTFKVFNSVLNIGGNIDIGRRGGEGSFIVDNGAINGTSEEAGIYVYPTGSFIGQGTFNILVEYRSEEIYGTNHNENVAIVFDQGCLTKGGTFSVTQISAVDSTDGNVPNILASSVFDIDFDGSFCGEYIIAIPYDKRELKAAGVDETNLVVLHETSAGEYERLKTLMVDNEDDVIAAYASSFGKFCVAYPRIFGLILGLDDENKVRGDLDADHVYDALKNMPTWAGSLDGNPNEPIKLIMESANVKSQIEGILNNMHITVADVLVYYYSGHGGTVGETGLESPVIVDGNVNTADEQLLAGSELISDEYLPGLFRIAKWNKVKKVFILDACHTGGFVGSSALDSGDLETLENDNWALLAAATETSKAFADPCNGTGIWTNGLLKYFSTFTYEQLCDYLMMIKGVLIAKYGGQYLPLRRLYGPGDIGLFEYDPVFITSEGFDTMATLVPTIPGNLDGSGGVNFRDFAIFASYWGEVGCEGTYQCYMSDVAPKIPDGIVNMKDLAILSEHWLIGTK